MAVIGLLAATHRAPARMPMLVMLVTSSSTVSCRRAALPGWLQNQFCARSTVPVAFATFAAQSPKP
ncbi:hypothetical protein D3C78_1428380 [compost metagenome]